MSDAVPRLRMFAGPNGSGKTTVKNSLNRPESWFGLYLNPDDIEATIRRTSCFPIEPLALPIDPDALRNHFASSTLLARAGLSTQALSIRMSGDSLMFDGPTFTSYHASVFSDYLRRLALMAGRSFSFETVMSAMDKVETLKEAQARGYRTYLYFVATEDAAINIQRVRTRVAAGGHDVPVDKVVARYHRSLMLLKHAIPYSHRAFLFDTSEEEAWYFAEIVDGDRIELQSDEIPTWFQPIWDG